MPLGVVQQVVTDVIKIHEDSDSKSSPKLGVSSLANTLRGPSSNHGYEHTETQLNATSRQLYRWKQIQEKAGDAVHGINISLVCNGFYGDAVVYG
ncbi:hypothetical protein scyTo_0009627 [Scyliorhinus torazame]|uniref:Uncharacterized protein n=1 Tax=Scyliorhinus torazame TaxID=75743 RepID=A0A401NQP7_SCYTO|nr:hypothetical protein [Scyliorhinus torazame]